MNWMYDEDIEIENNAFQVVYHPWRRYFARTIDMILYGLISFIFFALINPNQPYQVFDLRDKIDYVVSILLMLFLEPLWLMLWGTTPGKWILGLQVRGRGDEKLTYSQGFARTRKLFLLGLGLGIPIVEIIALVLSYRRCVRQEDAPWDDNISYSIKDTSFWRGCLAFGALILMVLANEGVKKIEFLPPHRGDVRIKEFSENYNYYSSLYEKDKGQYILGTNGQFTKKEFNSVAYYSIDKQAGPSITYKFTDGFISEISMEVQFEGGQEYIPTSNHEFLFAALAFGNESDSTVQSLRNIKQIQKVFKDPLVNNFKVIAGDVTIDYEIQQEGYYDGGYYFIPEKNAPNYDLRIKLTLTKINVE